MSEEPVILRRSNFVRRDGWLVPTDWAIVEDISLVSRHSAGNYLYRVDGVEYHSRSAEWLEKLSELQIWGKLQNV